MKLFHTFDEIFEALRWLPSAKTGMSKARERRELRTGFPRGAEIYVKTLNLSALRSAGHWPTLLTAFLYFDFSFMVWTVLGPLGAQIGDSLGLTDAQRGLMVAVPTLAGAILRIMLGLLVDRIGGKNTGLLVQF